MRFGQFTNRQFRGWGGHAFALAMVAIAFGIRYALDNHLGSSAPYLLFFLAIVVVVHFTGPAPIAVAVLASILLVSWFFIEPQRRFGIEHAHEWLNMAFFAVASATAALLAGSARASAARERESAAERRRAEEALERDQHELRLAHQRLTSHMENSPLAVIEFDRTLRLTSWSRGAVELFGWATPEVLGKSMWELPWIHDEDRPKVRSISASMLAGVQPRTISLNRNRRKDGTVVWCEWYNSALTSECAEVQSILSLVLDVTDRVDFTSALERQVDMRTQALRKATEQVNSFCYTIAHDLKAPLRAQHAFATILDDDYGAVLGDGRHLAKRVADSALRQSQLIDDLLAHLSVAWSDLPLSETDLKQAIEAARAELATEIARKNGRLEIDGDQFVVLANEASLHVVLVNLLSNALKFVPKDRQPRIHVRTEPNGDRVRIWVEDNGIGIDPRFASKLFRVFQRLHACPEYPGTGIGLAIVKQSVERMGGAVGFESQLGKGTRFWIELQRPMSCC